MDFGHHHVVHEELSSGYTDVCELFIGVLGGGCMGTRSRSGHIRVRGSGNSRETRTRTLI